MLIGLNIPVTYRWQMCFLEIRFNFQSFNLIYSRIKVKCFKVWSAANFHEQSRPSLILHFVLETFWWTSMKMMRWSIPDFIRSLKISAAFLFPFEFWAGAYGGLSCIASNKTEPLPPTKSKIYTKSVQREDFRTGGANKSEIRRIEWKLDNLEIQISYPTQPRINSKGVCAKRSSREHHWGISSGYCKQITNSS